MGEVVNFPNKLGVNKEGARSTDRLPTNDGRFAVLTSGIPAVIALTGKYEKGIWDTATIKTFNTVDEAIVYSKAVLKIIGDIVNESHRAALSPDKVELFIGEHRQAELIEYAIKSRLPGDDK